MGGNFISYTFLESWSTLVAFSLSVYQVLATCPSSIFERQAPQFQIISAAKTGSTSLYAYMCQNPSIKCLAKKKELNLLRIQERKRALETYLKQGFGIEKTLNDTFVTFEASIHYYHYKVARDNMYALLPCSKLVWMVRNPLPRAVSEYLHQAVKSQEYPTFESLINKELDAISVCNKRMSIEFSGGFESNLFKCLAKFRLKKYMLSTGFYGYFMAAWLSKFPLEQHLFLDYEEFKANPKHTIDRISTFLGLNPPSTLNYTWNYNKANTRDGVAAKKRAQIKLSLSVRDKIRKVISPYVEKMYELVGVDFGWQLDSLS